MLTAAVGILVIATLGGFGWWAASRIDGRALEGQTQAIRTGLADLAARTALEQQSSTLWDDAVLKVRERDDPWLAENLVEWISRYFGYDRVYLLDPSDVAIRAASNGSRVDDNAYERDRAALDPLVQLGLWVLRTACAYASRASIDWIAVNVSPLQFRDEDFADRVFSILEATGLRPNRLELEITEGLLLQNSPSVQATLRRLRASGVRVALDDFGTGYSSISYLRTYGVDKLKIDRSYIAQLDQDLEVEHIVRCIIDLAHAMHMKVTAEGLETEKQRRSLENLGCNQLQGYLLSRPVTPERLDILANLKQRGCEKATVAS